jgi:hypothetical protein
MTTRVTGTLTIINVIVISGLVYCLSNHRPERSHETSAGQTTNLTSTTARVKFSERAAPCLSGWSPVWLMAGRL